MLRPRKVEANRICGSRARGRTLRGCGLGFGIVRDLLLFVFCCRSMYSWYWRGDLFGVLGSGTFRGRFCSRDVCVQSFTESCETYRSPCMYLGRDGAVDVRYIQTVSILSYFLATSRWRLLLSTHRSIDLCSSRHYVHYGLRIFFRHPFAYSIRRL